MMGRIIANPEPCTGCLSCLMACAQHKSGSAQPQRAGLRVHLDPFSGVHRFSICHQCDPAPCAEVCPRSAITRNDNTGALQINRSRCISCRACVNACPYSAMFWNAADKAPVKCDLCQGDPQCIHACHFGVLHLANNVNDVPTGIPAIDLDPKLGRE